MTPPFLKGAGSQTVSPAKVPLILTAAFVGVVDTLPVRDRSGFPMSLHRCAPDNKWIGRLYNTHLFG